jgi:hypothetical protein
MRGNPDTIAPPAAVLNTGGVVRREAGLAGDGPRRREMMTFSPIR